MAKVIDALVAGAMLCALPVAAGAQDVPGGRPPTQSITVDGPTTSPNWGLQAEEWYPPREGRIAQDWVYGNRFDNPDHVIWNETKRRMLAGEDVMGFTASRGWTPERYCEMANAGYDYAFVNIQHQALDVWQVADMYDCGDVPATFSHGARIPDSSERWIQAILDAGAMTLVVPTVDTKEEAEQIVHWALFPPLGARSSGGGLINSLYADVPGGYRNSFNDNIVIIAMIETLEGVENAYEIASVPGIDAVFAASGDLGNFSGYAEGDEAYEWLIQRIVDAARAAGKPVCGPADWHYARNADNPVRTEQHFTCFQGGSDPAEDLAERVAAASPAAAPSPDAAEPAAPPISAASAEGTGIIEKIGQACDEFDYEEQCFREIERAVTAAASLSDEDKEAVYAKIRGYAEARAEWADDIGRVLEANNIPLTN